jgi:serine/threonine protein kinase
VNPVPTALPPGAPITGAELLALLRKSQLVRESVLDAWLEAHDFSAESSGRMAKALIKAGLLTYFQAEQLLQGRWHGFQISGYRVLERIGCGGMGNVFLCEHPELRRRVAIKVPFTELAADPVIRERFQREAQAGSFLSHRNVVRIYDFRQDFNVWCLVQEYVDGSSLRDIVTRHGPLDVLRAVHYVRQAAAGLQHLHDAGLIHRDIKPGNLLLSRTGVVKIFDMGLVRFYREAVEPLTKHEIILGTADYIAPEQAKDSHAVDVSADIYGLGATFYFLLCGQPPVAEGTVPQKLVWLQTRAPQPIRSLRAEVPEELAALIDQMLTKDPTQRLGSAADVLTALTPWVGTPVPPPPAEEMPRLCPALQVPPARD